jgi:hypothetical protein
MMAQRTLDEIAKAVDDGKPPVPLALQIAEVEREIAMRANVYPKLVRTGKMRQGEADEHIRRMRGVLATLRRLDADDTDDEKLWNR